MSNDTADVDCIKEFIFNDDVQNILLGINNNVMDFNILEITGMGDQEIKHSNLIGWLFGDNEHGLGYSLLESFLKKVADEAQAEKLKRYIYLPANPRQFTVYREKDNIDLLLIDEANHIVFAIENKVYADERTDGDDGGQLSKYEDKVERNIDAKYQPYFIFLTLDLQDATRNNWLKASHQMIGKSVQEILDSQNYEISDKTKLILTSYVDLLTRRGIMGNEKLQELCQQIWANKDYANALKIIMNNRPGLEEFKQKFKDKCEEVFPGTKFHNHTKSDIAICTPNWQKVFTSVDDAVVRFGVYITPSQLQLWVRYDGNDESDKYGSIYKNIKTALNKKGKKGIYIFAEKYDGYNIDEVGDQILEEFIGYLRQIDKCFEESK